LGIEFLNFFEVEEARAVGEGVEGRNAKGVLLGERIIECLHGRCA
jgi:hypothetical protein